MLSGLKHIKTIKKKNTSREVKLIRFRINLPYFVQAGHNVGKRLLCKNEGTQNIQIFSERFQQGK